MCDYPVEHSADPIIMDTRGSTAIHHAIYSKNTLRDAKLLAHNANNRANHSSGEITKCSWK
jgi:ankyrin repeat protein